jgi:hypothetical protein
LVELLNRALDQGVIVAADVIISVAGVPLIGLNLRLGLASIETMLKYGMMTDWDAAREGTLLNAAARKETAEPEG